jgi:hypothetical protein
MNCDVARCAFIFVIYIYIFIVLVLSGVFDFRKIEADITHCFTKVLNGCCWQRGKWTHMCTYDGCCNSFADAVAKVVKSIVHVLLRAVPTTPVLSDWTKLGPALDFYMVSEHQGILHALLTRAGWAMKFPQNRDPGPGKDAGEIDWQAIAGSRYRRSMLCLQSQEERFHRTLLALVMEPLRHLHSSYLKYAHAAADDESWPKLLNEVWPRASISVAAQQYFSTMLEGTCPRFRLVWQLTGCSSFQQWVEQHPAEAKIARSQILMVTLLLRRRHNNTLNRWPWKLFSVADARRDDQNDTIIDFYSRPPCCREPGFAREMRESVTEGDFRRDLSRWRWVFLMTAFVMKCTVAAVERRHAVHGRLANPNKPWHMFCADSVLAEARHQTQARIRLEQERKARLRVQQLLTPLQPQLEQPQQQLALQDVPLQDVPLQEQAPQAPAPASRMAEYVRKQSALNIFRIE